MKRPHSKIICSSLISAYDELEAPTNVTWSGNRVTWDAVPNATGYTYEYYNSTGAYVGASNTSNTQTVALSSSEDGWYVKVKATASGYRDSQWKESTLYDSGTASETLTSLSATVTAPVGGEHPSFTVTVPDGAHYTATVYAWYDLNNNGAHLTNSDTFVTGNEYQARIHFTANTGYEIANSASYTINGTPNYATFDTAKQRGMNFVATAPAVTTYTVTYDANGGTGSMADETGVSGDYVLPACGFTAPNGQRFKAWLVGGNEKAVGDKITVSANTVVTAVWEAINYGDLNGDGDINAVDAVLLAQKLAGWDVDCDELAADCNGDDIINAVDAVLLAQYLAGWDVSLG